MQHCLELFLVPFGYQGITKLHSLSCTPTKKRRKAKLDLPERQHNRLLARLRVVAEHVNRRLKIFRIMSEVIAIAGGVLAYAST